MTKSTKISVVVFIIIILLIGFEFYSGRKNDSAIKTSTNTPPVPAENGLKHFTDTFDVQLGNPHVYTFDYNPLFSVIEAEVGHVHYSTDWSSYVAPAVGGTLLAQINIPETYMPQTNFSEARFTVGRSADAIKYCTALMQGEIKNEEVNISGYPFSKFTLNDAGAGNFYETTSYRGIIDGNCYAIEYTIHSTNIGNYSPDQGIKEFDKAKIVSDFENIVKSFKFVTNNN